MEIKRRIDHTWYGTPNLGSDFNNSDYMGIVRSKIEAFSKISVCNILLIQLFACKYGLLRISKPQTRKFKRFILMGLMFIFGSLWVLIVDLLVGFNY